MENILSQYLQKPEEGAKRLIKGTRALMDVISGQYPFGNTCLHSEEANELGGWGSGWNSSVLRDAEATALKLYCGSREYSLSSETVENLRDLLHKLSYSSHQLPPRVRAN